MNIKSLGAFSDTLEQIEQVLNTKDFEKVQYLSKKIGKQNNDSTLNFAQRIFVDKEIKLRKTFKKFINV